jgi:hypothetical protein
MNTDWVLSPAVRALERSRSGRMALRHWRRFTRPFDPNKPRVLCVGYVKTGTSSFGLAMRQLGFSHFGYDRDLDDQLQHGHVDRCLRWAASFNALDDLPWSTPAFIAAFRKRYPGAYYVELDRDENQWLASYFNFFGPVCSSREALSRLRTHQQRVRDILKDEPHVLRMNVCAGEGYEKLCPFLGLPVLDQKFPWLIPRK